MPVEVIPKLTLYGGNRNVMFVEHPQHPSQPLPMRGQPGQARHDHNIYQPCPHRPKQGEESRPPHAVLSAPIFAGADDFKTLLLCRLERIQFLFRQPVMIS